MGEKPMSKFDLSNLLCRVTMSRAGKSGDAYATEKKFEEVSISMLNTSEVVSIHRDDNSRGYFLHFLYMAHFTKDTYVYFNQI